MLCQEGFRMSAIYVCTLYDEARAWIADCQWSEDFTPEDIASLSVDEIVRGINRHYGGGWSQFVRDGNH